ncbi:MAG TPA: serine/threonine protein phosphatase, partial [Firmicutes bacterium]|nr:serine/threonine protein phosphatase [Bacillota bacterium]
MRKNSSEFVTSFVSEAGTFRTNKDYFAYAEMDDLACWIAADGIDSDEAKNSAEIAAQSIFSELLEHPVLSRRKLKKYLKNAHKALKAESRSVRLKVSMVIMVTDYSKMIWASTGNARFYHFRNRRLDFKSRDQSIAQLMMESSRISEDELGENVERNNLTNYLGTNKRLKIRVSKKFYLNDGDAVLLCTAGFWENINNVK